MALNAVQQRIVEQLRRGIVTVLRTDGICGRGYSFQEAKEFLSQTNLASALESMAMLNAVAPQIGRLENLNSTEGLAHLGRLYRFLFSPHIRGRVVDISIKELTDEVGHFTPLSPWACAAMTDACLRFCRVTGGASVAPPSQTEYFARILLSFQKNLAPDRITPAIPDFENLSDLQFADYTRNHLRANPHRVNGEDKCRLYALFEIPEVSEVLQKRCGKTASVWFEEQTGMTANDYRFTLLALMGIILEFKLERPDWAKLTFDLDTLLANMTSEARGHFTLLNQLAVIDLPALRAEPPPSDWKSAVYGANSLLRKQLLQIGPTRFVVLHHDLFVDRYFRGLVHVLDDAARSADPPRSWKKVREEFGYLFEGYIRWWLRNLFGPTAHYLFGRSLNPGTETDAVVVAGRTALVLECNHHWLSRIEAFEATPAKLAAVVTSDLIKAIRAARTIAAQGVEIDGQKLEVDAILPIAVLPESLPIGDMTAIRFRQELSKAVEGLEGVAPKIRPAQILSQNHLEFYDKAWLLPEQGLELAAYLVQRAGTEPTRFCPVIFDAQKLKVIHSGHTWDMLHEASMQELQRTGPGRFRSPPASA
jgi:hypothetical protein